MALNGIDIASYQAGINLENVPCDFVIIKATQGTEYVNPDFIRAITQARNAGKLIGVYHYIGGQGARAEMQHFVKYYNQYKGIAIPCLDWESVQNSKWRNESYLEQCIKEFIDTTGIPPIIYASHSVFPYSICKKYNCGTWVARYASNDPTGYQDHPWKEDDISCAIRQYSSRGTLDGWGGYLDLDKAYMDAIAWSKYATGGGQVAPTQPEPTKDVETLANEVLDGKWGNGPERKQKLTDAGYDYAAVQARVNEKMRTKTIDELAHEVIDGKWGNNPIRRQRLTAAGYDYKAIQKRVNELL